MLKIPHPPTPTPTPDNNNNNNINNNKCIYVNIYIHGYVRLQYVNLIKQGLKVKFCSS